MKPSYNFVWNWEKKILLGNWFKQASHNLTLLKCFDRKIPSFSIFLNQNSGFLIIKFHFLQVPLTFTKVWLSKLFQIFSKMKWNAELFVIFSIFDAFSSEWYLWLLISWFCHMLCDVLKNYCRVSLPFQSKRAKSLVEMPISECLHGCLLW